MGHTAFDFLTNSFLFNDESIKDYYKDYSNSQIENELHKYRDHCLTNYKHALNEIDQSKSSLKVFSSLQKPNIELLTQTALYLDQFVIYDPLFKFTESQSQFGQVSSKYLGYQESKLEKTDLANNAKYLKSLTPMVASDFIKILPLSYHFEAPENPPLTFTKNFNNDILPENILNYFWEHADVKSMKKVEGGWLITDELFPCRGIHIEFNELKGQSSVFHLLETKIDEYDEKSRIVKFHQTLPDSPPTIENFNSWVTQSVNSTAKHIFDRIYVENFIASKIGSTYLCDNIFTSNLLRREFKMETDIQTFTANELINIELPFLSKISIDKLMEIRKFEADVFTNFRFELERNFRELRNLNEPNEIKIRKENILHELNDVQGGKISKTLKEINRKKIIDAVLLLGGLIAASQTGGFSLLASAVALGKGYKDFKEYSEKVKENPSYLLWTIQK
jgi:hypothetical protein